jgi:hypothetical protein
LITIMFTISINRRTYSQTCLQALSLQLLAEPPVQNAGTGNSPYQFADPRRSHGQDAGRGALG